MIIAVPKETAPGERRVALIPDMVRQLVKQELEVVVERGAGAEATFSDDAYETAGAKIESDVAALFGRADVVLKVQPPGETGSGGHEADLIREGSVAIGFMKPLDEPELAGRMAKGGITSFALELMPRITRAQSMDVLSSQNTVQGYRAVLLAAQALPRLFPMMVTAAGTISPARVLIVGAGVAGLQAIATARRLGAVVEAYDTRPAVKEQVQSLGARFVELEIEAEDAEDAGGYARAQTEEFYAKQRELLGQRVRAADVVITTALVPGQTAPRLIEEDVVRDMKPGSVIVDLAAEKGGNCAVTKENQVVFAHGVQVMGPTNLPSTAPFHASQLYSKNITTYLNHLVKEGKLIVDLEDELTRAPLLTYRGEVMHEETKSRLDSGGD